MESLASKLKEMEDALVAITEKIAELEKTSESKNSSGIYSGGNSISRQTKGATDIRTGLSPTMGGKVFWNSAEMEIPSVKEGTPVRILTSDDMGYNKHSHSKFSGGALDINTLEVVEYKRDEDEPLYILDKNGKKLNQDCQSYWHKDGKIEQAEQEQTGTINKKLVDKIGKFSFIFDPQAQIWGSSAFEIDVDKCYFVRKETDGTTMLDINGKPMRSKIYDYMDDTKTSMTWDEKALVWRFYACYAEEPSTEEEPPTV